MFLFTDIRIHIFRPKRFNFIPAQCDDRNLFILNWPPIDALLYGIYICIVTLDSNFMLKQNDTRCDSLYDKTGYSPFTGTHLQRRDSGFIVKSLYAPSQLFLDQIAKFSFLFSCYVSLSFYIFNTMDRSVKKIVFLISWYLKPFFYFGTTPKRTRFYAN